MELSDEQSAAATYEPPHAMIIAPPGCGKTEVLAHRAKYLLQSIGDNRRLLALTFTNRAKMNLEERLRQVLEYSQFRRRVLVRNFHGHATRVVLAHGRTIGLNVNNLELPTSKTTLKAFNEPGVSRMVRDNAILILDRIKRDPLSDEEIIDKLEALDKDTSVLLAIKVEKKRQVQNQLHFGDLLRHAQCLLQIPAVANLYRCHFGAVLVDEFQDLSLQQLDIARLTCTERQTYAGDLTQGIFRWAGASPDEVESEVRNLCGEPVKLRSSYRSSPKVLSFVNSVSAKAGADAQLVSAYPERWPGGGLAAALTTEDQAEEASVVVALAEKIVSADPSASVGVISRAGWRRGDIDKLFTKCSDVRVHRWDLSLDDPQVVRTIRGVVSKLPTGATLDSAREAVLAAVDPSDLDTREQLIDAFDALASTELGTIKEALSAVRTVDMDTMIEPGVHLLNAHTGKGQQFDWVFVIGVEEKHIPSAKSTSQVALQDELHTLLVMLSRARYGLIATRAKRRAGQYGPYQVSQSRWWNDLQGGLSSAADVADFIGKLKSEIVS